MKSKLLKKLGVCVPLMCFGIFSFIQFAQAAQVTFEQLPDSIARGDFVVGPGKFEMEVSPGDTQNFEITIANRLGVDRVFKISEEDFKGSTDPSQTVILLGDDKGPYSLKDYVDLATTSILIPNGVKVRVPIKINIPSDAQPGGLYGSVIVSAATDKVETDSSSGSVPTTNLITRIGTLFFIRVKGPVTESGSLSKFMISGDKSLLMEPKTVMFDLLYKNDGNVNLDPYGTITVKNMLGSTVGTIAVDPWFAMPQSLRFREVEWKLPFMFGRYVAHANINRGYGSSIDEADVVFWVIPWKILLAVLAGIIIIVLGFRFVMSRFKIVRA